MKAMALPILSVLLFFGAFAFQSESRAISSEREQELFLAGANAISKGRFDEGRILLNTLLNTYPESPLVEQTKILVFYSYARQQGSKDEKAATILKEIEEHLKSYKQKRRFN